MFIDNLILILASLGLFQGFLLCLYLFTLKKGNRKSNIFLALLLLGLTMRIGKSVGGYYIPLEAWERNIGISGIFITGPFLWFYGITLLKKNYSFSKWNYLHLAPFLLFISLLAIIPSDGRFAVFWNYGLVVLHLVIYLILSWTYLWKNRSYASAGAWGWYRNILVGVTLVWLYYLGNFLNYNLYYIAGPLFYTFLIYAFSYLFLNRHHFGLEKYAGSTLDRSTSKDLFEKVKMLFLNEPMFLEPGISLNTVAEKLAVSPRSVSQVVNENGQQDFNSFVNQYRIEHAKTLLVDLKYKDEKIATIAYESGFGTVTAFNVAFKKKTGTTPSEYRKKRLSG